MANWIQGAIKHPGALRKEMGVKKGEKLTMQQLQDKAATLKHLKNRTPAQSTELRRVNLAETLKGFKK